MSGLEKTIVAVAAAVAVVIINTLRENARVKKTLSQCVADANTAETFEFKGGVYSKNKYIEIAMKDYAKKTKGDLQKMIKSYQKTLEKGKLTELQILDLQAMQRALEMK